MMDISDRESFAFLIRQGQIRLNGKGTEKRINDSMKELVGIYNGSNRSLSEGIGNGQVQTQTVDAKKTLHDNFEKLMKESDRQTQNAGLKR